MAVITTGAHPKALWPGVHAWFGLAYNKHPMEWDQIFDVKDSTKNYEEDVEATGFGLAPIVPQGEALSYDSHAQGYTKRYTPVKYGLGYIVTEEEEDDNQYEKLAKGRAEALAFSMRTTKEIVHANILDRATNSSYVGGDGKELLATDHPSLAGNWANELSAAADFSEAALEDLLILIGQAKNARGLQIGLRPMKLIVPVNLQFEAQRVLKSELRVGTGDNDINAIKSMGLLPEGYMVNHYVTDTDQWFVKTDAPNGLTHFRRKALAFAKDSDFDTANKKHKATERYVAGWTDPRAIYGSPGV
jgi:hypothetical protein